MRVFTPYKETPVDYYVIEMESDSVGGVLTDENVVDPLFATGYIDTFVDITGLPVNAGVVVNIRKYTFNFILKNFEQDFTDGIPTYTILRKASEYSFEELIFTQGNNYIVRKIIAKVDEVPEPGPVEGSWDDDPTAVFAKQENYFQRKDIPLDPDNFPVDDREYEIVDAQSYRLTVYGSYERALAEAKLTIFPPPDKDPAEIPENPTPEEEFLYIIPGLTPGRQDAMIGEYRYYYPDGVLRRIENWDNFSGFAGRSVLNGEYFEYYADGNIRVEGGFNGGRLNGSYKEYHNNGTIRARCRVLLGAIEGLLFQFDQLGNRTYIANFINGNLNNSYALDYTA